MVDVSPAALVLNRAEGRPRAGWRIVAWIVVALVGAMIGATVWYWLVSIAPPGQSRTLAAVAGSVGFYALPTAITLGVARWLDRRPLAAIGVGGRGIGGNLVAGLAIGVAMTTAVFVVEAVLGMIRIEGVLVVDPTATVPPGFGAVGTAVTGLGPLATIALLVPFFVAVGVAEEVLVRGYLLTNVADGLAGLGPITERRALWAATLATGGLFGILHFANPNAGLRSSATIAAVGVLLGWTYVVTGDLGIPIGIHVTWNLTLGTVYGFPVSGLASPASLLDVVVTGPPLLTGGSFGPEAGLVMVLPIALAVGATAWWVRRTTGSVAPKLEIARYERTAGSELEGDG